MDPSRVLLNAFLIQASETAFRDLVERELSLVYGTALRRTGGDEALSREITQMVFIDLAVKAGDVPKHMVVAGWLHRHTGFIAAKMLRAEQRRRQREHTAAMEQDPNTREDAALWREVAPLLDEVLEGLPTEDRDAVILRYLEGRGLREVGISLGVSENTARMRVNRALEKLRQALQRRGVTGTALALTGALAFAPRVQAPESWAGPMAGLALKVAPAPVVAGTVVTAAGGGVLLVKGAAVVATVGLIGSFAILYPNQPPSPGIPHEVAVKTQRPPPVRISDSDVKEAVVGPHGAETPAPGPTPIEQVVPVAPPVAAPMPVQVPAPPGEPGDQVKLMLGVLPAVMKFDRELLTVRAGQQVMLLFHNAKCPLQHNFILAKPGTLPDLGAMADRMLTDPQAMAKNYVPASADVLAQSTKLLGLGQSDLLEFSAPDAPGDYPFLCTFPGHWRMMHGILRVLP